MKRKGGVRPSVGCSPTDCSSNRPSLLLGKAGEGSWADGCSELEGGGDDRDWLLLLLVSLLKTADWLLPLLWMGLEVQSSPGCFFWTSAEGTREEGREQSHFDGVSLMVTQPLNCTRSSQSIISTFSIDAVGPHADASAGLKDPRERDSPCGLTRFWIQSILSRATV